MKILNKLSWFLVDEVGEVVEREEGSENRRIAMRRRLEKGRSTFNLIVWFIKLDFNTVIKAPGVPHMVSLYCFSLPPAHPAAL